MKRKDFWLRMCSIVFLAAWLMPGWQVVNAGDKTAFLPFKIKEEKTTQVYWGTTGVTFKDYNGNANLAHCDLGDFYGVNTCRLGDQGKQKAVQSMALYTDTLLPPYANIDMIWNYELLARSDKPNENVAVLYNTGDSVTTYTKELSFWTGGDKPITRNAPTMQPYLLAEVVGTAENTNFQTQGTAHFTFENPKSTKQRVKRWLLLGVALSREKGGGHAQAGLKTRKDNKGTKLYSYSTIYYHSLNGTGSKESPLQIGKAEQLKAFADIVNSGLPCTKNLYAVLTEDIDYTSYTGTDAKIGNGSAPFSGEFDGQGHSIQLAFNQPTESIVALFRSAQNATIKNLSVTGSLIADRWSASIVGTSSGSVTLENVSSSVELTATSKEKNLGMGGLVQGVYGPIYLTNCAFTGKILTAENSQGGYCGGLVGCVDKSGSAHFKNCFFAPSQVTVNDCIPFAHGEGQLSIENCYYTYQLGSTVQGTKVSEDEMKSGKICWKLNGSKNESSTWLQTIGSDDSPRLWGSLRVYERNGLFYNFEPPFRGAGTEIDPFQLETFEHLSTFRDYVNKGYTSLCAKLVADIDMADHNWMPIGRNTITVETRYQGTFDGNGYTLSNLNVNHSAPTGGLFALVRNATIKNLIIHNATVVARDQAAPIAGWADGKSTIINCGVTGIVNLSASLCAGLAVCSGSETKAQNSYTTYSGNATVLKNEAVQTNCYCNEKNVVENMRKSGELTWKLNGSKNENLTTWVQTLDRDAYPRLRGAKCVKYSDTKNKYYNEEYTDAGETGFIETTSGKDFRVIHHGGRLYEIIVTIATQDDRAVYTLPTAKIQYLNNDLWTDLGELSDINKDTLSFAQDWWGKINLQSGNWYTPYTYDSNVPTFWAYQGNHSTCKQASLIWIAPDNLTDLPRKFRLMGSAKDSELKLTANMESTTTPADDSGLSFVDPMINMQGTEAGGQITVITAAYRAYAYAIWDATDNKFVTKGEVVDGTTNLQLSLPPVERNHNMVALVCSRYIDMKTSGSSDTTYVNYAYPFVQKPTHSILRSNSLATHNINNELEWEIGFPNDTDVIDTDMFMVARSYTSDYASNTILTNFYLDEATSTSTQNDTLFGKFSYSDTTNVDYTQMVKTSDSVSVFDSWKTIHTDAMKALNEYRHPACYLYYKVYRPMVSAAWEDSEKFTKTWKVLQYEALPTVDSVRVIKDSLFEQNNKVKVRIVLNNPYPWDVVPSAYRDNVQKVAKEQHFDHRMFVWDKNAIILLQRFSKDKDYDEGSDLIWKSVVISGDKVQQDSKTGAYYVEYEDKASIPFVNYYYKAMVNPNNSAYPICERKNTYTSSSEEVRPTKFGGISNLKATCGTLNGAVQITWDADENEYTTLSLKRREYQRGYESTTALADWTDIDARDGSAVDKKASAAVVNEYVLTITTKCRGTVYTASDTTYGYAGYYGSIEGRVKLSNGVNMPGNVKVKIQRQKAFELNEVKHPKTGKVILPACNYPARTDSVTTDANGAYTKDSLPYYGEGYTYTVYAACEGGATFVGPSGSASTIDLNYNDSSYTYSNIDFTCKDTKHFSGRILYTNSTVPVRDVMFYVNGTLLRDAKGEPVKTDAMGNFSFIVPRMPVTVRAFKNGHTLSDDGYVLGGDKGQDTTFTPTKDYDGLVIYDDTKVRLVGRVAGGAIEGNKPMGFGLSQNILGDSITLVFTLEGDHTSYLYYDKRNPNKTSYTKLFAQSVLNNGVESQTDSTEVSFEAKRIVVKADNKTGEFCLDLFPTKYVLSQVYANGYSTLYSAGEGLTVMDLTDSVGLNEHYYEKKSTKYDGSFCKVYHAPVEVEMLQLRDNKYQKLYGAKEMEITMLSGTKNMQLSWLDQDGNAAYTFSHPVYKGGSQVSFQVKAYEPYYYNNVISGQYTRVPMEGYRVSVNNGLNENGKVGGDLVLNAAGSCLIYLAPDNTSFTLTEEDALRYLSAAVEINGYRYESEPIGAYVTGERDFGLEVTNALESEPNILDIIRDPYGTNSYAYRTAGTTYHWERHYSRKLKLTCHFDFDLGIAVYSGYGIGVTQQTDFESYVSGSVDAVVRNRMVYKDGEFELTLNDKITTSSDPMDQGAMADLYVGSVSTADIYKYQALSVVDSLTYLAIQPMIETGAAKLVKAGVDEKGKRSYFVICNGVTWAPGTERTFIYSQHHILNVLIPELQNRRAEALRLASSEGKAKEMAEASGKAFYYLNSQGEYTMVAPSSSNTTDTVELLDTQIENWQNVIAANERTKVDAMSRTADMRYSVAGTTIEHSEDASTYYRVTKVDGPKPISITINNKSGDSDGDKDGDKAGDKDSDKDKDGDKGKDKDDKDDDDDEDKDDDENKDDPEDANEFSGFAFRFSLSTDTKKDASKSDTYSNYTKATGGSGYVISTQNDCYFDMDVYYEKDSSILMVNNMLKTVINKYEGGSGILGTRVVSDGQQMTDDNTFVHSYIFVMRGGATREPWLDADSTKCYKPEGSSLPLGSRTLKINNPVLYIENPVVNNLPQDENAIFTIHMSNESELSANTKGVGATLKLQVVSATNPHGAIINLDGENLLGGMSFPISPGKTLTKTIEVQRGGKPFDYENIQLQLSDESYSQISTGSISVHYLPTSTPVTLTQPAQNFLINTLSQKDEEGKYYIPVQIEGFSTTKYDNFDHIELQYKRETDSEDQWINLCSYFTSDSLYNKATGTKAMIETEGKITNLRFYGEKDPVEQNYDLRAVSFCRLGNGYTTRMSSVISGTKDTRCPEVFGQPKPEDGILGFDDVISLPFTEPIAYNYLDETANFSVLGYTNNSDVDNSVALYFPGESEAQAVSSVDRVLNNMDFSIEATIKIDADATDTVYIMLINDEFSEDYSKKMGFGYIPKEDKLIFGTNRKRVYTWPLKSTYGINLASAMTHVGMVYTAEDSTVHFYVSEQEVYLDDKCKDIHPVCTANGPVYVGRGLKGKINNIRLWSKALNLYEMTSKYKKLLSANESNLLAYWPANEGSGTIIEDKANGANLDLKNVSWSLPNGYSVDLDHKTMAIRKDQELKYSRNSREDYTIAFYFKVDQLDGDANLFAAGGDNLAEQGQNKVRIRFIDSLLYFVSEDQQYAFGDENDYVSDAAWHHLAVSVNHAHNQASLFIDGQLVNQFDADQVGGVVGSNIVYGDTKMAAHIDQVQMWSLALPAAYIRTFHNTALTGKEKELQIYLPFEREEMNSQGTLYTAFSPLNHVIVALTGEIDRDTVIDETSVKADNADIAPVRSATGIENLPFTWKSTNNELQILVNKNKAVINNQHICFVVRRVEDLHGNPMANAQMWTTYVNRNILTWNEKNLTIKVPYTHDTTIVSRFNNISGRELNYKLSCTSPYITLTPSMGTISPLSEKAVAIQISDGLAPGVYSATVNLVDEDGLCSKQMLYIYVEAVDPKWSVALDSTYKNTMDVEGMVMLKQQNMWSVDMTSRDKVGAFIDDVCVGVANLQVDRSDNSSFVYINIKGKAKLEGKKVEFRLYRVLDGLVYGLTPGYTQDDGSFKEEKVYYKSDTIIGIEQPIELRANALRMQNIQLNVGWNWISINVHKQYKVGINELFSGGGSSCTGQVLKTADGAGFWTRLTETTWSGYLDTIVTQDEVYQVWAPIAVTYNVFGEAYEESNRTIMLRYNNSKWAAMPYLQERALPINIALSDFVAGSEKAPVGTIIKGYNSFAMARKDGTWRGSLQTMRPGEGYYCYRNGLTDSVQIHYPDNNILAPERKMAGSEMVNGTSSQMVNGKWSNGTSTMMPVIAAFADGDYREGDAVLALCNKQVIAESETLDELFLLALHANKGETIQFAKVRDGVVVAVTSKGLKYDANGVAGTFDHPYLIDFSEEEGSEDTYDILGRKMNNLQGNAPQVLIQGKKKVIKR